MPSPKLAQGSTQCPMKLSVSKWNMVLIFGKQYFDWKTFRDFLVLFSQLVRIIIWFRFISVISANVRTSASCLQERLECKISGDSAHISPAPTYIPPT